MVSVVQNDYNLLVVDPESEYPTVVSCLGIAVPVDLELKYCLISGDDDPTGLDSILQEGTWEQLEHSIAAHDLD